MYNTQNDFICVLLLKSVDPRADAVNILFFLAAICIITSQQLSYGMYSLITEVAEISVSIHSGVTT